MLIVTLELKDVAAIYERKVSVLRVMRCLHKIGDRAFVILLLDPREATVDSPDPPLNPIAAS